MALLWKQQHQRRCSQAPEIAWGNAASLPVAMLDNGPVGERIQNPLFLRQSFPSWYARYVSGRNQCPSIIHRKFHPVKSRKPTYKASASYEHIIREASKLSAVQWHCFMETKPVLANICVTRSNDRKEGRVNKLSGKPESEWFPIIVSELHGS